MIEPSCKIAWRYEGYRDVQLFDLTGASRKDLRALCTEIAEAIEGAEDVAALSEAIHRVAAARSLVAEVSPGPSHSDPFRDHVNVGLQNATNRRA